MGIDLEEVYKDLHRNPELSFQEHRTSGIVAETLRGLGLDVVDSIAGTGVVGVLENGPGPTVLLRADMDALPVAEETGLDYASRAVATDEHGRETPVMHACGHDVHVTCLLGAVERLVAERDTWSGTLVALFQPGEEGTGGATTMVADGLYDRVPRPDVVLGQHVVSDPAGTLGAHPGPAFSGADEIIVRLFGRGGHGSMPETTVDPILMAAAVVMRLQGIVAREVAPFETAVVTVGTLHAGTKENIIPDEARLGITVRNYDQGVRDRVVAAIERIVRAEAEASGAPRPPEFTYAEPFPVMVNDPEATERTMAAFRERFGDAARDPGALGGSEDVGVLATAAGVPLVYWLLGGADPETVARAEREGTSGEIPSNHSALFAPVLHPTLELGVEALVTGARAWLAEP